MTRLFFAISLALFVAACQQTSAVTTVCAPWRAITYDGQRDTRQTIQQVRVHNLTGAKLGCWK